MKVAILILEIETQGKEEKREMNKKRWGGTLEEEKREEEKV